MPATPLGPVDLAATAREVVQLYELGSPTRFDGSANGLAALAGKRSRKCS
jgi:hypothetical protein